jgi:glycosyltransferase involved in cell wall biosynthesis
VRRFDHAFVIPAYGESPHIEACIASLAAQRVAPGRVIIATSTPSTFLAEIASRHGLPLAVNPVRAGIGGDWNFALATANADWVTIAHQDDLYRDDYLDAMSAALAPHPDALIAFSDYDEIDPDGPRPDHINLRVKRRLCRRAFGDRDAIRAPTEKRRLLAWGNPVCCPSVVVHRSAIPDFRFGVQLRSNLDWEGWLNLADRAGAFVYVREPLVTRRIHPASETTALIADEGRLAEDRIMFRRIWPAPVAALILTVYRAGYLANRI